MYIKQSILILSLATFLVGCGGGSSAVSSRATTSTSTSTATSTATATSTSTATAKAVHSGQVKDSSTGNGLADVKVSLGESTTTTDKNGFYAFSDLTANEEVVINFEKEGYLLGSTQIQLKAVSDDNTVSPNYLEYIMRAHKYSWDYESTEGISGGSIMIDASYVDIDGNPYSGTISAKLTVLDFATDESKALFSGSFKGINNNGDIVQFESYGLTSILLEDSNGNTLSLANGETGTLIFNKISSSENSNIIPLWYYDYDQGLWFEEGYAELQEDGSYKGDISHLGTWSLNKPLEEDPGIYRGRIIDENGAPIGNVRVYAVGENWVSSDLTTDENGIFELKVIPDESFELTAYDYQNKYGASYNGTIAAITSGDVVEN